MYYLIFDLEWNNVYSRKHNGFFNEIIEIGALLADESLKIIDTFSILIKSQLGKKLSSRVKKLTNISNEDLKSGVTFGRAIKELKKWINGRDCVFMSWGNSDVRTLLENYRFFMGTNSMDIMPHYADLQKYCQTVMDISLSNQIGLSAAALHLGIDPENYSTHRALEDCRLSFKCMKKCHDPSRIASFISDCDDVFFKRLEFKVHNITNIQSPNIDRTALKCECSLCGESSLRLSEWKVTSQAFRALFYCKKCNMLSFCSIRFKETFDGIIIISSQKRVEKKN